MPTAVSTILSGAVLHCGFKAEISSSGAQARNPDEVHHFALVEAVHAILFGIEVQQQAALHAAAD